MKAVTVATKNPGKGKRGPRVDAARYDAMKTALLAVIPKAGDGVRFVDLEGLVEKRLPQATFAGASVLWYATIVKLDLEARGLIRRVPGSSPQRLVRTTSRPCCSAIFGRLAPRLKADQGRPLDSRPQPRG
jgi:hypothetical protein